MHAGEEKDAGGDVVEIKDAEEVWLLSGKKTVYFQKPDLDALQIGDLSSSAAHWCETRLLFNVSTGFAFRHVPELPFLSRCLTDEGY